MRIFQQYFKGKKEARRVTDYYQASLNRAGREQLMKLVKRGLRIPVAIQ